MEEIETIKQIVELGSFGVIAFIFVFAGMKMIKFMDRLLNNHASHMQTSLENIDKNFSEMSKDIKGLKDDLNVFTKTIEVFLRGKL